MGSIIIVIVVFLLAIVGFDKFLIGVAIGAVAGVIMAIIETVQRKKGLKQSSNNTKKKQLRKSSQFNNKDEIDDGIIDLNLMRMIKNNKKTKSKKKSFDWEIQCESCGELLEDCECDWRGQSKQDISQDMDDLEFDEMLDYWDELDEDK